LLTWSGSDFVLRIGRHRELFVWPQPGVIFDMVNMKTGWCSTAGVAPQWQWNREKDHFEPQPSATHKKGFSIPCAIADGRTATWEQSGVAIWNALTGLVPFEPNKLPYNASWPDRAELPLLMLTGAGVKKYKKGSTTIPRFWAKYWVDRPACLGGDEPFDFVLAKAEAAFEARQAAPL
jgi:hypothetical protein